MEGVFLNQGENLFFGFGLVGKVMYMGVVAGVLTVPKLYALRGAIDMAALRKFPAGMKWALVSMWNLNSILCVLLFILVPFWGIAGI